MVSKKYAITTCRVSSDEQLDSGSLDRQQKSVLEAAEFLGVEIPNEDYCWSGSISSKSGVNYSRKDLRQMLEFCKKNPGVKYVIVDEVDRFMRSMDEMFYWEVEFREGGGAKVWYAEDPELNSDDPFTKLRRAIEAFRAEGSNVERHNKSIKGQTAVILQGKWPYSPKPGYRGGKEKCIPDIHPQRGPALKVVLQRLADGLTTPTRALQELNESPFMNSHSLYKMDKFRNIATDPFYAGIIEINKQVKARCENGLYEPLITLEQHHRLIHILDQKPKNQKGPRKNGNPLYPLSNLITCEDCKNLRIGRLVGLTANNGQGKTYGKYRCRECQKYRDSVKIHDNFKKLFSDIKLTKEARKEYIKALEEVFKRRNAQAKQDITRVNAQIENIEKTINRAVDDAIRIEDERAKNRIYKKIDELEDEKLDLKSRLDDLKQKDRQDYVKFMEFALEFADDMGSSILDISQENRLRCKQMVFPGKIYANRDSKVYTNEISLIYRSATMKKDAEASDNSHLVRVKRL